MNKLTTYLIDDKNDQYYTFISPEILFKKGLKNEIIIGKKENDSVIINNNFKKTINSFFEKIMIENHESLENIKNSKDGWFYVIDNRKKSENPPKEDIIGAYEVINNKINCYKGNPNYKPYTKNGFINLGNTLNPLFLEFIENI